jgi:long-chain acyl-CoA synthetase
MNLAIQGERNLERFGEYPALVFEGREITNAEQLDEAARLATAFAGLGIVPGDRVGVLLPNSPAVTVCYGAILRIGAVVMPVVFLLAPPEIRHILADSGARAIVTSPEFYGNVKQAIAGLASPPLVIVTGTAPEEPGVVSYEALLQGASDRHPIVDRAPEDLAVVSYTSGTTGRPKGVMLTHANLLFNAENTSTAVPTRDGDVSIGCLPLAHLFGIGSMLVGQLFKIKGVLLPWFTAEGFFDAVTRYRATSSALVPTMVSYMLAHPGFDDVDWSGCRWFVVAAAPVPVELADELEKRTGARVLEGYGLTETSRPSL